MADPAHLDLLLSLQDHDLQLDQLDHRRATLPERQQLEEIGNELTRLGKAWDAIDAQKADLVRSQSRIEDEATSMRERIDSENTRLYSGSVAAHRELIDLQDEINFLNRRVVGLEDQILELMEQTEPLDAELEELGDAITQHEDRQAAVSAELAAREAQLDAERSAIAGPRNELAEQIADQSLLDEYERLRRSLGGIGVARVEGSMCGGCHLGLPAVEVDRFKHSPAGTTGHCEECGRLLIG